MSEIKFSEESLIGFFFILFFRSRRRGTVFLREEREGKGRSENATNIKKDVSESESP